MVTNTATSTRGSSWLVTILSSMMSLVESKPTIIEVGRRRKAATASPKVSPVSRPLEPNQTANWTSNYVEFPLGTYLASTWTYKIFEETHEEYLDL